MLCELWMSQRYLRSRQRERFISLTALISMMGIAVGVIVLIVVIAVMSGFDRYLEDKLTGTNAHIVVNFPDGLKDDTEVISELQKIPSIVSLAPFIAGQAIIKEGKDILGVEFRGIDIKKQQEVTKIKEYLTSGSLDLSDNELVIGKELALNMNLRVGDSLSLISPTTFAPVNFKIKGIFNSGMYLYDSNLVITSIKGAQNFLKTANVVPGINIKVDNAYNVEKVKQSIYEKLKTKHFYSVMTWIDMNRNFLNALKIEKTVMFIVVVMTTVVAAFGIVSTLIMSVMSRIKDIAVLRAIGAKTGSIMLLFLLQGVGIGFVGIALGIAGGILLASSLNRIVDFISGLIGHSLIPKDIYYFDRLPTSFNTTDISIIAISAFVISLLASLYPAYRASRINLSEALRHE
ncbi:MAG: ABC transporter permease [Candidatus Omnitrophica bacterium]|nr:ABC transporter permease [Candidatus Omnitrophota bacterium]